MLRIRQGRAEDAPLLSDIAFQSKAYWGYSSDQMEAFRPALTYKESDFPLYFFGVAEDPMVIGFYALDFITNETTELAALFVKPDYIKHGYGRALFNHAKIQAKVLGASELVIESDPNSEKFYCAMGAAKVGARESESITGRFLPLLKLAL